MWSEGLPQWLVSVRRDARGVGEGGEEDTETPEEGQVVPLPSSQGLPFVHLNEWTSEQTLIEPLLLCHTIDVGNRTEDGTKKHLKSGSSLVNTVFEFNDWGLIYYWSQMYSTSLLTVDKLNSPSKQFYTNDHYPKIYIPNVHILHRFKYVEHGSVHRTSEKLRLLT